MNDTVSLHSPTKLKPLYIIGGVSALLQLAAILGMVVVMFTLVIRPSTAQEAFDVFLQNILVGLLRGDLVTSILIVLYLGTFPTLYLALRQVDPLFSALATLMTRITVTSAIATEYTLSLLHLSRQHAAAGTKMEKMRWPQEKV